MPPSAVETRWVEIRPRLKNARHFGATSGPISISFETRNEIVIGFRLPGAPASVVWPRLGVKPGETAIDGSAVSLPALSMR